MSLFRTDKEDFFSLNSYPHLVSSIMVERINKTEADTHTNTHWSFFLRLLLGVFHVF